MCGRLRAASVPVRVLIEAELRWRVRPERELVDLIADAFTGARVRPGDHAADLQMCARLASCITRWPAIRTSQSPTDEITAGRALGRQRGRPDHDRRFDGTAAEDAAIALLSYRGATGGWARN
jgi:hypothetical protein